MKTACYSWRSYELGITMDEAHAGVWFGIVSLLRWAANGYILRGYESGVCFGGLNRAMLNSTSLLNFFTPSLRKDPH